MADGPTKTATKTPSGVDAEGLAAEQARVRSGVTDEDGGEDTARAVTEPVDEGGDAPDKPRLQIDNGYAEKRNNIAQLAREKRAKEMEEMKAEEAARRDGDAGVGDGEDGDGDSARGGAEGGANDRGGAAADAGEGGESDAPASQERKIKLKVDGVELELPESEVVALAQKGKAGDNRFETSKEVLAALKSMNALTSQLAVNQRGTGASGSDSPDSSTAAADKPDSQADDLNIEELEAQVERLQVGDTKEGAQALLKLLKDQGARIEARVKAQSPDVNAMVDQRISANRMRDDVQGAVDRYHTKYPEIQERPLLREAAGAAARDELLVDLKKAGAEQKDLQNLSAAQVIEAHQRARAGGHIQRSYDDILEAAAKKVSTELGFKFKAHERPTEPARTPNNKQPAAPARIVVSEQEKQDRLERKRNTQQPRTAGVRGQPGQGNQQTRPKTPQEIVADMKVARQGRFVRR